MNPRRRRILGVSGIAAAQLILPKLSGAQKRSLSSARVVVVGGGYGGATAARYLRLWSGGALDVTLVEREPKFVSCPASNLVIGGSRRLADITRSYDGLRARGVNLVRDEAIAVDPRKKSVRLRSGGEITWDRLILAPGVHLMYDRIEGYDEQARSAIVAAWRAGAETAALARQLETMPDGGVLVIAIPLAPYRCPPAPYERACQAAFYLKHAKPRSKVLILDANEEVASEGALFRAVWKDRYPGMIEYRPNSEVRAVNARQRVVKTDFDEIRGDVLNVLPPMRAGEIARTAGLITANDRWCEVNWLTMESVAQQSIHVLGDSVLPAPAMSKSGHMANQHGKLAAAAIIALLSGEEPDPQPVLTSTCYSFVSDSEAIHVASVHRYDPTSRTFQPVHGAGGVSAAPSRAEGAYGWAWALGIWADMLS